MSFGDLIRKCCCLSDGPPDDEVRACCLPDGSCQTLSQEDCEAQGGIWVESIANCAIGGNFDCSADCFMPFDICDCSLDDLEDNVDTVYISCDTVANILGDNDLNASFTIEYNDICYHIRFLNAEPVIITTLSPDAVILEESDVSTTHISCQHCCDCECPRGGFSGTCIGWERAMFDFTESLSPISSGGILDCRGCARSPSTYQVIGTTHRNDVLIESPDLTDYCSPDLLLRFFDCDGAIPSPLDDCPTCKPFVLDGDLLLLCHYDEPNNETVWTCSFRFYPNFLTEGSGGSVGNCNLTISRQLDFQLRQPGKCKCPWGDYTWIGKSGVCSNNVVGATLRISRL